MRESKKVKLKIGHNLARISKGSMIGTRFNTNKDWVGGSIAYFDQA
jgi:hypothetical protein